ncbi:hypothetical protein SCHPADRAFT_891424 [Schizopora paradoxa]|uniref:Uncharacterized protein n=1 Tax=Schizopora paradoxa TaxID=27342 RepID=A0A0H2RI87_9AGAM|nr:hypothetical protein SCHPADRAFT_891424 [Schizopora paradoxa]
MPPSLLHSSSQPAAKPALLILVHYRLKTTFFDHRQANGTAPARRQNASRSAGATTDIRHRPLTLRNGLSSTGTFGTLESPYKPSTVLQSRVTDSSEVKLNVVTVTCIVTIVVFHRLGRVICGTPLKSLSRVTEGCEAIVWTFQNVTVKIREGWGLVQRACIPSCCNSGLELLSPPRSSPPLLLSAQKERQGTRLVLKTIGVKDEKALLLLVKS